MCECNINVCFQNNRIIQSSIVTRMKKAIRAGKIAPVRESEKKTKKRNKTIEWIAHVLARHIPLEKTLLILSATIPVPRALPTVFSCDCECIPKVRRNYGKINVCVFRALSPRIHL